MEQDKIYVGTGRRKNSVARIFIKKGTGNFSVNGRELVKFFPREIYFTQVREPLEVSSLLESSDVKCFVSGGGVTGQSGAIRLGIARALLKVNPDLRKAFRQYGLLTRDPREVERKKYGQKGARGRFQYSKR